MSSRSQPSSPPSDVGDRFLEIADVMMIAIDASGEMTYTNAKARDILGYEPGTLAGADWFDMCIPDRIQEEVRGVFDRLMAGEIEADERHENAVVTADGEERIIEWHNTILRDDEGRITGTLSSGQDVTERKERKKELKRQELYLESVSDIVTVVEVDGTIRYDSPGISEMLGYDPDARVGESAFTHIHPDDRERVKERFQKRVTEEGASRPIEYRARTNDGEWIWVESRARVLTDTPLFEGIVITTRDITERKRVEHAAREREERLNALVEATTEGVYRISSDWSDIDTLAGEGFLSDDHSNTWQDFIPRDERERVKQAVDESIETQSPFEMEHRVKHADGTIGWAHSGAVPILEDGEIVEWFGTSTDITERKEREAELERHELYLESVSDLTIVVDEDGVIKYESPGVTEMLDYEADERVGESALAHVHPEDRDQIKERLQKYVSRESVSDKIEFRVRKKDGTWLWVESRANNRIDSQTVNGIVITLRDITERKEREAELERHELYLENIPDLISVVNESGAFKYDSPAISEMLGYDQNERIGDSGLDYIHPDDRDRIEARLRDSVDSNGVQESYEYRARTKDGEWIWIESRTRNLIDNQQVNGIVVTARDITERKKTEKQYQTLLETAPDPIVVAETETGEIIEVNEAAESLFERPENELIGRPGSFLYPTESKMDYESFFTDAIKDGGTWRRLPDGSHIHVVTGERNQIPVEVSVQRVELGERDVVFGIFHDISEQLKYERRLTTLNKATRELLGAKNARDVEQTAVKTLGDLLNVSTVAFYHFDEVDWELQPVISTDANESGGSSDDPPVLEPGVGVEWDALSTGETTLVDDFRTRETEYEFERTVRSELVVPVADRGVLVAGDTQPAVFTDQTVSLVETLGTTAEAALSRAEREQQLQDQRRELQQIESINEQIRDISHAVVQSETRAELEQMVCECLVRSELVDFAWIGRVDLGEKQLSPQARAGDAEGYLDSIPLGLDSGGGSEPAVQAARSRDVSGSSNIATDLHRDDWRSVAVERGFQSILSIPLVSEETLYGVLSVYAGTQSGFPTALRSVLEDLGDLLAHSVVAIEQKHALHATHTMELDFAIQDQTCLFCRIAAGTDLGLELDRYVPQSDQSTLIFARITDGTPDRVLKEIEQLDGVERSRLIERETDTFVQMYVTGPFLGSELSNQGLILRRLSADETGGRITVEVPRSSDARQAVDLVMSQYEDAQLLAKRESSTSSDSRDAMPGSILETLTTRQREVIETAYRCGYFDSPRNASGKDIAEMFGFSNPTFHEHVREAERKLFDAILQGDENFVAATESADSD